MIHGEPITETAPGIEMQDQSSGSTVHAESEASQEEPQQRGVDTPLAPIWQRIQASLGARLVPEQFETWFRRATLQSASAEEVVVAVQNKFVRDWLESYYRDVLEAAVREVVDPATSVRLAIDPELTSRLTKSPTAASGNQAAAPAPASGPAGAGVAGMGPAGTGPAGAGPVQATPEPQQGVPTPAPARQRPALLWNSDIVLNPKYTFDNYVVGPCNRFPFAAAMGAGENPGGAYNPYFLHGSVGLGKTHLLQSICFLILERQPDTRILYLSCETFVNHFINALETGKLSDFRNKYRNVDVLVVDDIHLLANKERTQEEFFHTFNTLYNAGKQIVLSSDSPPKDIPTLQERLVSRFKWGMVTEILPPCFETRMAIIKRKSRERNQELSDEVAQFIAERVEENVRELEGAVTKLLGFANLTGQEPDMDLVREALRDLFEVRKGQPSIGDIAQMVVDHFGVKLSDLQSKRRTQSIAYPRQMAMYLTRKVTRHSLEEIGAFFGGRDHSTVLYAVEKITKQFQQDAECKGQIETFLARLGV